MFITRTRRPRAAIIAAAILWALLPSTALAAPAADTDVRVRVVADGTAPFDGTDTTGFDRSGTNLRVRTLDSVRYRVDYQFNHAAATAKTVTLAVTGGRIDTLPSNCRDGQRTSSTTGTTLTCTMGALPDAGAIGTIDVDVVVGAVRDGSLVEVTATTGAAGATASATAADVTVTATPRWNIGTDHQAHDHFQADTGEHVFDLPITVEADLDVNTGRGTEGLTGDLEFTVTPDFSTAPTPVRYRLVDTPVTVQSMRLAPCGGYAFDNWDMPFGTTEAPAASPESTTSIGGTWSCEQPGGPGTPIDVRLSGANLAPLVFPSISTVGAPLFPRKVLVSGQVLVAVSRSDVAAALQAINGSPEGVLPFQWTVDRFDPTGLSGGSNFGDGVENPYDNTGSATIVQFAPGTRDAYFTSDYAEVDANHPIYGPGVYYDTRPSFLDPTRSPLVPNQSAAHSGDGFVTPGQTFAYRLTSGAPVDSYAAEPLNAAHCAFVDPAATTVVDQPDIVVSTVDTTPGANYGRTASRRTRPGNGSPVYVSTVEGLSTTGGDGVGRPITDLGYVVEYGTGPRPAGQTCRDDDSETGWTTDPASTPGAAGGIYPAITMIRVRALRTLEPGEAMSVWISLRANSGIQAGDTLVARSSHATWPVGTDWPGDDADWHSEAYDPADHQGTSVLWGDRVGVATRTVLTTKSIVGGDPGPLEPGDEVSFTVTATVQGSTAESVTMTDELPAGLELVSTDTPTAPSSDADTLVWTWGETASTLTRRVTYRTRVTADAVNGSTLVNEVHTDVPGLAAQGNVTDAAASVTLAADFAQLEVWKTTGDEVVEVGDPFGFSLHARNTSNVPLTNGRWIDVFPYHGDGRTPASRFDGSLGLESATASSGTSVEYTSTAPEAVDIDPDAASNGVGGSTVWCTVAEFGSAGCPAALGEVTAVRFSKPSVAPTETVTVDLSFAPVGNAAGDVYTNRVAGRDDQTPLLARSEDVSVTVVSPTVRVAPLCAADAARWAGASMSLWAPGRSLPTRSADAAGSARWTGLHSGHYRLDVTNHGALVSTEFEVPVDTDGGPIHVTFGPVCASVATATTTPTEGTDSISTVSPSPSPSTTVDPDPEPDPADGAAPAHRGNLAFTGGSPVTFAVVGAFALVLGAIAVAASRPCRRRAAPGEAP